MNEVLMHAVVWANLENTMLSERKKVQSLSRVRLFTTPWTVAHQVPLSMGISRQEYWSGLPFPSQSTCTMW